MYENVLWSNWHPDHLSRVVIFGNSFQLIGERTLSSRLREETPLLAKVVSVNNYQEVRFDDVLNSSVDGVNPIGDDVFNDCALTWFQISENESGNRQSESLFWDKSVNPIRCTPKELMAHQDCKDQPP